MKKLIFYFSIILCTYESPVLELDKRPFIPNVFVNGNDPSLSQNGAQVFLSGTPFSGYIITHYSNGQLKSEISYSMGLREGKASQFYKDGNTKEERWFHKNHKSGTHLGWWPNGKMKFEFHYIDGYHHGEAKEWQMDGTPYKLFNYTMGKEDGAQKMWESDGSIRANYVVKDGHRYGLIGLKNCKSINNEKETYSSLSY